MIKRKHLEIIREVQKAGSLSQAAKNLFLTQSALSHSIAKLEAALGIKIWNRVGRKLQLTQAGKVLVDLAARVIPDIEHSELLLSDFAQGKLGILRIGMECHPCYQWLQGVIMPFMKEWDSVDVDIMQQFQFDGLSALCNHDLDLLITPDPVKTQRIEFIPVFDYELVLVIPAKHKLAEKPVIKPEDLASEILFTYPVKEERLDIYNYFLNSANVMPRQQKPLESTEIMLQMVVAGRGVAALPRWLVDQYPESRNLVAKSLGKKGVFKKIWLGIHESNLDTRYIQSFITIAKENSPGIQ